MGKKLCETCPVFPSSNIFRTAQYYQEVLGFQSVRHLQAEYPSISLIRDGTSIILTQARAKSIAPNRELYGYGLDAYITADDQMELQNEFANRGAMIIRPLQQEENSGEFVVEDIDGRWIGFGNKNQG